jgi:hypothetical protein
MAQEDSIEVLLLGSSQMKDAVNPDWLSKPAINLSSGSQHINSDFKIYTGLKNRLPALKTIVLEISYSHLELPPNNKEFWKNNVYLEYYDVNCFERRTWFKDRFIFLSNPPFYSNALYKENIIAERETNYNEFGFDLNQFDGIFSRNNYDEKILSGIKFTGNRKENLKIFKDNSAYLNTMLETFSSDNTEVILVTIPLHRTYLKNRNPHILKRRDSILKVLIKQYPNTRLLDLEADTLFFETKDFLNSNHLNPKGAEKFTARLEQFINE